MYLIAACEKCQILKNGSDYEGAWPPLLYAIVMNGSFIEHLQKTGLIWVTKG